MSDRRNPATHRSARIERGDPPCEACRAQGGGEHARERTSRCVSERAQPTTPRSVRISAAYRSAQLPWPSTMWRCPHCGAPQAETARCWVCRRSSTTCSTCRHFQTLPRRRRRLVRARPEAQPADRPRAARLLAGPARRAPMRPARGCRCLSARRSPAAQDDPDRRGAGRRASTSSRSSSLCHVEPPRPMLDRRRADAGGRRCRPSRPSRPDDRAKADESWARANEPVRRARRPEPGRQLRAVGGQVVGARLIDRPQVDRGARQPLGPGLRVLPDHERVRGVLGPETLPTVKSSAWIAASARARSTHM